MQPITLTPHLLEEHRRDAVTLLSRYFAGPLQRGDGFEGGWWDTFDPSGTRDESSERFTADDVLSASLLAAPIHPAAVLTILRDTGGTLTTGLRELGDDRDLASLSADEVISLERNSTIWQGLRSVAHMGPTRTSKLIARKRPRLIPIYDSVVGGAVYGDSTTSQWQRMHAALIADGGALNEHLVALRAQADLPRQVSALRVFDVLAWLDGSGHADRILGERH